jgi:hypothetical protein
MAKGLKKNRKEKAAKRPGRLSEGALARQGSTAWNHHNPAV